MMLESKLLSKVLDEKNFFVMTKYNVNKDDFTVHADVYDFIDKYVNEYGHTPDYRTVVEKYEDFEYMGEVVDAFPYLCKEMKVNRGIRQSFTFLQNEVPKMFNSGKNKNFLDELKTEVDSLYEASQSVSYVGSSYANNGAERRERYFENRDNRRKTVVPSPYDGLNDVLQMELTDYVLIQAFSNIGKSWIASHFGVHMWSVGNFGVLHYSPEMSLTQQEARNDTVLGKYNNTQIRNGTLKNEDEYLEFLSGFREKETPYIIKTMEHMPEGLTLESIEADLQQNPNVEVIIIDGFNLISHGKGRLDRNAMSQTSRKLRQLFGRYNVLGIVVHQVNANEEKENKQGEDDEFAERVPKPASIMGYSETLAVVQDSAHILSFDAVDGMGAMQLVKTRGEGKDTVIHLSVDFNIGKIQEVTPLDNF